VLALQKCSGYLAGLHICSVTVVQNMTSEDMVSYWINLYELQERFFFFLIL
jgi:hypothetical protein